MAAGKFIRVDSKGTYLWRRFPGLKAGAPTSLTFASVGLHAGDWVGLKGVGTFSAGKDLPGRTGLGGCFVVGEAVVEPAPGSVADRIDTPAVYPSGPGTDITQDFLVRRDETTMVRVPAGATQLRFGPPDSYFADNGDDGAYGLLLTFPNKAAAMPLLEDTAEDPEAESTHSLDAFAGDPETLVAALHEAGAAAIPFPVANKFAASPFGDALAPQWRGWYRSKGTTKGVWMPKLSRWKAVRPSGKTHYGWDLFAPRRTKLTVPIGPAYMQFISNVPGYGNVVAFRFSAAGKKFTAIYGHCDSFVGAANRQVVLGEVVALAGCSGNASTELCGADFDQGGRSDHVHLAVFSGEPIKDGTGSVDPGSHFGMAPVDSK